MQYSTGSCNWMEGSPRTQRESPRLATVRCIAESSATTPVDPDMLQSRWRQRSRAPLQSRKQAAQQLSVSSSGGAPGTTPLTWGA